MCLRLNSVLLVVAASLAVGLWLPMTGGSQTLNPNLPPGGNFNLTNWYLGLPVDSSGGTNGNSASIPAAQLTAGYSNANYFYTGPDGAMTFWAFVTGARTSTNTDYARSELREQIVPPSNSTNWVPYGVHTLTAQCRVTQVPSTKKVIIGQVHCYTGNARPLVKLQYNDGVIEALIKTNSNFDKDYKFFFQNVGLGNAINYQIRVENGVVTTTVNGSNQTINVFLTDPDWATNGLYFKAGSYCQDNDGPIDEGARLAFYSLARSHAPSVTNAAFSRSVTAGSNTTFLVNAFGNGFLKYQWLFNLTNSLFRATNASLTLTNVQSTNAGVYHVRVTDSLGVVTNQIATLSVVVPPSISQEPTNQTVLAGADANFAVIATGTAPLAYRWYFNTNTPVSGGTNATLTITNVSPTNAGTYSVVVSNAAGTAPSAYAILAVNRPPVPGAASNVTGQAISVSTPVAVLLGAGSDPDGDPLTVASVNALSSNGGNVTLSNDVVTFVPTPGFVGVDAWTYLLADNRGASATGTVNVTVVASNAVTLIPSGQAFLGDGTFTAAFQGVPGLTYTVDRGTNVTGPWEIGFTSIVAGANGNFGFSDTNASTQPQRFYRTRYP